MFVFEFGVVLFNEEDDSDDDDVLIFLGVIVVGVGDEGDG